MIKIEQIESIINTAKLLKKERELYDKWKAKKNQYDLSAHALYIDKLSHKLHCVCVEWWIACFEEYRYGEKKCHNWRAETMINYETPKM